MVTSNILELKHSIKWGKKLQINKYTHRETGSAHKWRSYSLELKIVRYFLGVLFGLHWFIFIYLILNTFYIAVNGAQSTFANPNKHTHTRARARALMHEHWISQTKILPRQKVKTSLWFSSQKKKHGRPMETK